MDVKKVKFYVVWNGRETGVFDSWEVCKAAVTAFPNAKYKSFENKQEANAAFEDKPEKHIFKKAKRKTNKLVPIGRIINPSIAVDAAFSGKSLKMEYQGVDTHTKQLIFHRGPFADGTNNVGEFLAIVHALAILKKHESEIPIYSDSKIAIGWVTKKKHASDLKPTPKNSEIFLLLERAEKWLQENEYKNKILKWETRSWGENPADFNRK